MPSSPWGELPPRAWQVEALPIALEALRNRDPVVLHVCTGAGKSYFTGAIVRSVLGWVSDWSAWRIVVLVPSQRLVTQTAKALPDAGVFYGRRKEPGKRVIVCCNDSAQRLADALAETGARVAALIVDEMHRSAAESVQAGIRALTPLGRDGQPMTLPRIGLTATPFRSGEDDPIPGWSRVAYAYGIDDATRDGVLVPMRVVRWRGDQGIDANTATVEMIREHAPDGPGVVSAYDIADAEWYADALTERGIPARAVHSRARDHVEPTLEALRRGELRCVVHVDLLTEGVDLPWLTWLALRRERKSPVAIVQEIGRVLRTHPGKAEAVVLDPHGTGVRSALDTAANLGDPVERARALREACLAERSDTADRNPEAVPAEDVGPIVDRLWEAVTAQLDVEPREVAHPDALLTGRQLSLLRGLIVPAGRKYCAASYVPSEIRSGLRDIVSGPDNVTQAQASRVISALTAVQARARQARQVNPTRWRGPATWRIR